MTERTAKIGFGISLFLICFSGALAGSFAARYIRKNSPETARMEGGHPGPGSQIIDQYHCPYSDTKKVVWLGKEDNYVQGNIETAKGRHPRLQKYPGMTSSFLARRDFDDLAYDKNFYDYLDIPSGLTDGIIVIGVQQERFDDNDAVQIADLEPVSDSLQSNFNVVYMAQKSNPTSSGWEMRDGVLIGRFSGLKDLAHKPPLSLLEFVNRADERRVIDIAIGDDVPVDFIAVAICIKPETGRGLTFAKYRPVKELSSRYQYLTCEGDVTKRACNPYSGDTSCDRQLPLACVSDTDVPVPADLPKTLTPYWSGKTIAYTTPVAASRFANIAGADAYCKQTFGPHFRMAEHHDGNSGGLIGLGLDKQVPDSVSAKTVDRVWIDIKDQPLGNCWAR